MKREEYIKFHREMCDKMVSITAKKNADYTGGSEIDDAFANFRQVQNMGICSVEVGFMTRISDKISRILSFMKKGFLLVEDESVEDTILDAANYFILFAGYLRSERIKKQPVANDNLQSKK